MVVKKKHPRPTSSRVSGPLSTKQTEKPHSSPSPHGATIGRSLCSPSDNSESSTVFVGDVVVVASDERKRNVHHDSNSNKRNNNNNNNGQLEQQSLNVSLSLSLSLSLSPLLRETERCFLRKDYRQSLLLVHRYFREQRSNTATEERFDDATTSASTSTESSTTLTTTAASSSSPSRKEQQQDHEPNKNSCIRLFPPIRIPLLPNNENTNERTTGLSFLADTTARSYNAAETGCSFGEAKTPSSSSRQEEASIVDQLAVIGLQSWYELSKMERKQRRKQRQTRTKQTATTTTPSTSTLPSTIDIDIDNNNDRWSLLVEILDYYKDQDHETIGHDEGCDSWHKTSDHRRGRISMEMLATVWISFWESNGHELEAFAWTIQALHCSFHSRGSPPSSSLSSTTTTTTPTTPTTTRKLNSSGRTIAEELWLRCVCQQIPKHLSSKNNARLARSILEVVTERRECGVLDNDAFEGIWKDIIGATNANATESSASCNNHNGNNEREDGDGDSLMSVLLQSIDVYLVDENGDDDNNNNNNSSRRHRHACVSRKTMGEACRWLLQQQREEQTKKVARDEERLGTSGKQNNRKSLDNEKPKEHRSPLSSSFGTDITGPTSPCSPTTGDLFEPLVATPVGPIAGILSLQNVLYSLPNTAIQTFKTICHEMRRRVLRLVYSSFAFSVSDQTSKATTTTKEQHQHSMLILRQHLQQALLSVLLFWVGWRGRRLLIRCGRAVVWASLAPLRELLEALGQPTSE